MVTTILTELALAPIAHQHQELVISLNQQLKETLTTHYILLVKLSPQTLHMKLKKCSTSPHTKLQKAPPASPLIMMLMMLHIPTYHIKQKQEQLVGVFLLRHIVIARRFFLNPLLLSPT